MTETKIPKAKTEITISMDDYMSIMERLQRVEMELAKDKTK